MVLATHGELCNGALQLQEWLVDKFRQRLELEGHRDDGESPSDLVADFRHSFHVSLLVAMVQGHADMLTTAGNILRKGRRHVSVSLACEDEADRNGNADLDSDSDADNQLPSTQPSPLAGVC